MRSRAENFELKANATSGFQVFLIALPLCLGIAMASGFPPVAGIISAGVGGLLASFLGGAPLTIKGPAAGLIVIAYAAVFELGNGDPSVGYKRCLAVGVGAAVLQIGFALFRTAAIAEAMPPSVVHGMLSAIGVIILAKQSYLMLGLTAPEGGPLELLAGLPSQLAKMNPEIALIGMTSLLILIAVPFMRRLRVVPAPLIVLLVAVPLSFLFDLEHNHLFSFFGRSYQVDEHFLVPIPQNLIRSLMFPDFSVFFSFMSLKYVLMFALVGTIESLLTVSAVDSIDPKKRSSDLNKDLLAVGVGNLVSALIGGLPMISEIVRSKANLDAKATNQYSNFFHGLFLIVLVALVPGILHEIPLAALAAMLVYTGARLASPSEFIQTFKIGSDQLFVFVSTFVVTLMSDLLVGVGVGLVIKLFLHLVRSKDRKSLVHVRVRIRETGDVCEISVEGPCIFSNYLSLKKHLVIGLNKFKEVRLDLGKATLIDHTTMSKIRQLQKSRGKQRLKIIGLSKLHPISSHSMATRVQESL